MKRTIRSISHCNNRSANHLFEQEDNNIYMNERNKKYLRNKSGINLNTDRKIQYLPHQNNPQRNLSSDVQVQNDKNIYKSQELSSIQPEGILQKSRQFIKFEQGKLVKQVYGNEIIKGFDNNNVKEYNQLLKKSRILPSIKTAQKLQTQQNQSFDQYPIQKDNNVNQIKNGEYSNIDKLLGLLNKTQKEKDLEMSQQQKAKLSNQKRKNDDSLQEKSLMINSDQKTNRIDNYLDYSPIKESKFEQNKHEEDINNYKVDQRKTTLIKKLPLSSTVPMTEQIKCPAKQELNSTDSQLKQFMNQYDDYFRHQKGECLCTRCICGGCRCDAKEPKVNKPMKQNKSNYDINYNRKPNINYDDQLRFQQNNYSSELFPKDSKFLGQTVFQSDYQAPSHANILGKIVPKDNLVNGPTVQQWGTSYNRNFINFGNVPPCYLPRGQDKTTVDNLKFVDRTTYGHYYNKKDNSPNRIQDPYIPTNSLDNMFKNKQPLNSETTHNHFYKPHNINVPQKCSQQDNLQTGAIPFNGQYQTNNNIEYGEKNKICPAKIEKQQLLRTRRLREQEQFNNSQKLQNDELTNYGSMTVRFQ